MTIASKLVEKFEESEVIAFEEVINTCSSVSDHDDGSTYRFTDNSILKILISDDHEFSVFEM